MIQAARIVKVLLVTAGLIGACVGICVLSDWAILSTLDNVLHIGFISEYILTENILDIIRVLAKLLVGFIYFFLIEDTLMCYGDLPGTHLGELINLDEIINLYADNSGESLSFEEKLTSEESSLLEKAMDHNTSTRFKMADKLSTLIKENEVKLIDDEGDLEMDVPSSMPAKELDVLKKQIRIIDSIIQTKIQEYEELTKKDLEKNSGINTRKLSDSNKSANTYYESLFN